MREFLREIGTRYPAVRENAEAILRLDSDIDQLPAAPFFEPVSLVEVVDGKRRLLALSADLLNAWRQHAAYGCRVRLRSMERGVFSELKACRLLNAMALARAHMEATAQAAYCEQLLLDTAESGGWDGIGEAVLRTMLGTSLRIAAKRTPRVAEFITPPEHYPLEIGETIKALDRFVAAGEPPGRHSQVLYSFLCEFAHPTLRGIKTFIESSEHGRSGWTIRYLTNGAATILEPEFGMALEVLLENMRNGYAASEILLRSRVTGVYPSLSLTPPSRADLRYVWSTLLQRPGPA